MQKPFQTAIFIFNFLNKQDMKEGAYIGAIVAFLVYLMLPIYSDDGMPASIIPTGHAVSSTTGLSTYVNNLPFSTIVFFALEVLGVSIGIVAQKVFSEAYRKQAKS